MTIRPLEGKRLLVLGAGHYQIPLIERAKARGCHVITMDYLPDNPGHRLADESRIISTVDTAAVLEAARRLQIDGVLTYGSDVSAPTVTHVAEELSLPGNPAAAGVTLQLKHRVRQLQARVGLPHPRFAFASEPVALATEVAERRLRPPWILKPADSSGSKGQSVIEELDAVAVAFATAGRFSRCGVVLAEELLEPDLPELVGDIWIREGRLAFRHYGHNYFLRASGARVPVGEIVPGFFGEEVSLELDRQLQVLIDDQGLRTGCLNFDGIVADGIVHLIDIGLRNGGNYFDDLIQLSTGFDLTEAAIFSALGVDYPEQPVAGPPRPALSYVLNCGERGFFAGVQIAPKLRPFVVKEHVFVGVGDAVRPYVSGDRALGVLLMLFPDMGTLQRCLSRIDRDVVVRIDDGAGRPDRPGG